VKATPALFFLFLLALPLNGFSQSTLNFPRQFSVADLGQTGFAFVNPSSTDATLTLKMYSAAGGVIDTAVLPVPARAGNAKLGSEMFHLVTASGWVQATSPTTGLQGFWLGGDISGHAYQDSAVAAPVAQELVFPLATTGTEINVASLATTSNTLTLSLYDASGTLLAAPNTTTVLPSGIFRNTLPLIFPTVNLANAKYLRVTGTGNITGTSVAVDFIYAPSWSVINGIDPAGAGMEANFPHAPSGPETGGAKFTSVVGITNLSSAPQTVTLTYKHTNGGSDTVTRNLSGGGSLREAVKDLFNFATGTASQDGWVRVTGTAPLTGFIAYGYSETAGVAVVPVQTVPLTQMIFAHVANGSEFGTGLALLNATATDAMVEIYVMRRNGALVGGAQDVPTASVTLVAGTKYTRVLNEIVPAANADDGFVYVKSTNNVPLYAFELFFTRDQRAYSNVAASPIDPSLTFTPPPVALTLTSVTPSIAARGTAVTLTGAGFSSTAGNDAVVFTTAAGTVSVIPSVAFSTSLTVTVPSTAITGPVYVTVGGNPSGSLVLQVTANSTTLLTTDVPVTASQNTVADIYVSAPAGSPALNNAGTAITDTSALQADLGPATVEVTAGQTKLLWITGDGISSAVGTSVSISGNGVTVTPLETQNGLIIVTIVVASNAVTGPRNIIVTNSNLDTSVYTGGLIIR